MEDEKAALMKAMLHFSVCFWGTEFVGMGALTDAENGHSDLPLNGDLKVMNFK